MKDTGVDLGKSVFVLHGASMTGQVKFRKKLSRSQFLKFRADGDGSLAAARTTGLDRSWSSAMR